MSTERNEQKVFMILFWPWSRGNPYQRMFYQALETYGFASAPGFEVNSSWLKANGENVDFVHIHWPENLWRRTGWNRWKQPLLLIRLRRFLLQARSLGIRLVWTIHNLEHHEGSSRIDMIGYAMLRQHSDLMIVHSEVAANEVRQTVPAGKNVVVMQHGNYDGCYPPPRDRGNVSRRLGLDANIPTVACLGGIRGYKGIDVAIEAAQAMGGRIQLVIAGHPKDPLDAERLSSAIADLPYVKLIPRKLSPQEFSDLHGVSDLILLPYRDITGSGALLAAWSFGRCVVASDLPFFREAQTNHPEAIDLFECGNARSLAVAIDNNLSRPVYQRQEAASLARVRTAWPLVINPVAQSMRRLADTSGCTR